MGRATDRLNKSNNESAGSTTIKRAVAAAPPAISTGGRATQLLMDRGVDMTEKTNARSKAALEELRSTGRTTIEGKTYTMPIAPSPIAPSAPSGNEEQSVFERIGNTLSGAAKGFASQFVNLGGLAADTVGEMANLWDGDPKEQAKVRAEQIREQLRTGVLSDGRPVTQAQRKSLQQMLADYEAEYAVLSPQTSYEERHPYLNAAENALYKTADKLDESGQRDISKAKEGLGSVGRFVIDAGVAGSQLAGDIGLAALTGGSTVVPMALRALGGGAQEARKSGADVSDQLRYGAGSALVSGLAERLGNVGVFKKAFGSGVLDKAVGKLAQKPAGALVSSVLSEGGEEFLEAVAQPVLQKLTYNPDAAYDADWLADALYSAAIGGVLGGTGAAISPSTWAGSRSESQNKAPQERQAVSGGNNTPAQQNAAQGPAGAAAGPVRVGRVTTIQKPYQGAVPAQAPKQATPVVLGGDSVNTAANRIQGAKGLESNLPGKGFKATLKEVYRTAFQPVKAVPVDGTTFEGAQYAVDINKNVAGKVINDPHLTAEKLALLDILPAVVRNGEYVGSGMYVPHGSKQKQTVRYDYFETPVTINGKDYIASFDVEVEPNVNNYRTHKLIEMDLVEISAPDTGPAPAATETQPSPVEGMHPLNADTTIPQSADSVNMNPPAQGAELPGTKMTGPDIPLGVSATREGSPSVAQAGKNASGDLDPLLKMMLSGKRIDQKTISAGQFDALAERGDIGIDAGGGLYQMDPAQHIDRRGADEVASRKVRAFQFDHPELQPYYRQAAEQLLAELNGAVRGGQTETATGEYGQTYSWRTRRQATARISALLDDGKMSYGRIEAALDAIIRDKGQENYADAKRVELVLDDMLTNGYNDGERFVPANPGYLAAKDSLLGSRADERGHGLDDIDDGLGAANAGFAGDYNQLQNQSSSFYPEGANAARPVDVPTQDFEGRNISKSASTVMGAQAIPDDVVPMIEQMVADGRLSYNRRSDQSAIDQAKRTVEDIGFAGALERFRKDVTSGKASKDTVVLGQTLLNNAANARDGQAAAEILSLYQSLNTNIGQAMQAASILRKLSPEAQLYGVQRSVENMKAALAKQMGGAGTADIKIDDALIQKFLDQTDQAGRDAVMREIYQNVADQVPSNWRDKWNAWRYLSMLGNPRTHIRNILGNAGFQPVRAIKNEIAAVLETALSAAGVEVERTKSFAASPSLYRAAWNDYANAADILSGSKYDDVRGEIQSRRRIFRTGALEAARKGNSAALEWEDAAFKRITYTDALAGYLKANGVTAAQLESGQVESGLLSKARDYAAQEALKATYQDNSQLADLASARFQENTALKRVANAGVDAVLPFRKTPANILSRALEYSPAGLAKSLTVDLRKVQKGDMSVSQALDNVAAGLTGSVLFALGAYLFAQGLVTGGQGDGEDDKWAELLGHQGYALELEDGTSITLDWLAPESLPFFMGVELMSAMGENGMQSGDILTALLAAANPMLELSMMQGVSDLIESVKYTEGNPIPGVVATMITSYFSQVVPTLLGQIERSGEEIRMTTYTDKNADLHPDVQYALGRASSRLPGVDYNQIPYIDAWGREEETGDLGWRLLNNAANPAYISQVEVDEVESELQRLRDATGETSVFPDRASRSIEFNNEKHDLTAEQYTRYAKEKGQNSYRFAQAAISSKVYKGMGDGEKAAYIDAMYGYADYKAKKAVFPEYTNSQYEKYEKAEVSGMTPDAYYVMTQTYDYDGSNAAGQPTKEEAKRYLDTETDLSRRQKADLWTIINKSWEKNNPYAS